MIRKKRQKGRARVWAGQAELWGPCDNDTGPRNGYDKRYHDNWMDYIYIRKVSDLGRQHPSADKRSAGRIFLFVKGGKKDQE